MIKEPNESAPQDLPTDSHSKYVEENHAPVSHDESYDESRQNSSANGPDWLANILATIGIVIVAVIVVWGLVHLIFLIRDWAASTFPTRSNVGATATSTITRTTPSTAKNTHAPGKHARTTNTHKTYISYAGGTAHLAVSIIRYGIIDPATGALVQRAPLSPMDVEAVQFDITNVGNGTSGTWYFDAQLPVQNGYSQNNYSGYNYRSPAQAPLAPGAHIVNTLRFSPLVRGGGTFTVSIETGSGQTASQYIPSAY